MELTIPDLVNMWREKKFDLLAAALRSYDTKKTVAGQAMWLVANLMAYNEVKVAEMHDFVNKYLY